MILVAAAALMTGAAIVSAASLPCGMGVNDWCPASPGNPCGRHRNTAACLADPTCYGMVVADRSSSVVECSRWAKFRYRADADEAFEPHVEHLTSPRSYPSMSRGITTKARFD